MANARKTRFTIYDVMESQGVFENNPANACSPMYKGPQEYPKMFYHPEGRERITQRAEIISTPMGPERVGEIRELISRGAADADEEAALRELGWHDHPAKAIKASGREMPPVVHINREADLEEQIKELTRQLTEARSAPRPAPSPDEKFEPKPRLPPDAPSNSLATKVA
jgi:hypothetical protein